MLYTIRPMELIYANHESMKSLVNEEKNKQIFFETSSAQCYATLVDEGYIIERIISGTMEDFLNPELIPGASYMPN